MSLSKNQKDEIKRLLESKIEDKLRRYKRETLSMPFLALLIQDNDKVAAYSFMHSLSTTLGMSIYEQVSKIIVEDTSQESSTQYDIGGSISNQQSKVIDNIIRKLRNGEKKVNHDREVKEVLSASPRNGKIQKEGRKADFYMKRNGKEHYFEIKTVKPNIDVFTKSKKKLLEWVARRQKPIKIYLVLPYNPYHPDPYDRFTEQGVLERRKELLIGEEYWDFIGGKGAFRDLKKLFNEVGKKLKRKIHKKIKEISVQYSSLR